MIRRKQYLKAEDLNQFKLVQPVGYIDRSLRITINITEAPHGHYCMGLANPVWVAEESCV